MSRAAQGLHYRLLVAEKGAYAVAILKKLAFADFGGACIFFCKYANKLILDFAYGCHDLLLPLLRPCSARTQTGAAQQLRLYSRTQEARHPSAARRNCQPDRLSLTVNTL